jgi:hypothetical protein
MEIPETDRSSSSSLFTQPPVNFQEYDVQKKLLVEIERITTIEELNMWYVKTKSERDRVISQTLRNILMDSIRERKNYLENKRK